MRTPAPSDLHQLFYISRSLARPDELDALLRLARQHNERRGVTGTLLFTGGHFAQLLEGPAAALAETMAVIRRDRRHEAIHELLGGPITQRRCGAWSMAFVSTPGADDLIQHLLTGPLVAPERAQRLLQLMLDAAGAMPAAAAP
jgi:hypothetical protein